MPRQETFFEESKGGLRVEVLKSYDQGYALEVFRHMDEDAQQVLWQALKPEETYDPEDLPSVNDPNDVIGAAESFMWDELLEQAREDGNLLSFFIVNEIAGSRTESLYVSADWPSAENFARQRLAAIP